MPPNGEITLEDGAERGRYVYTQVDMPDAEMTFSRPDASTMAIDHTFVPPEHRGQGIAFQLVARAVADAREHGWRIRPRCSYVAAQFAERSGWGDVLDK